MKTSFGIVRALALAAAGWICASQAVAAESAGRARVAFDREGGFTVGVGEEASVTATLEGGSGWMWFHWEGNNGGTAAGDGGATFAIDTGVPGEYWLKATGGSDGTDGEFSGKIRFRVVGDAAFLRRTERGIQEGETVVWSEDFAGMTSGSSTVIDYNGWTGDKCYNISNSVRVGSSNGGGYVTSTNGTLGGSAGRLEFSLWKHDSGAAATLQRSVDGGNNWIDLTSYASAGIAATSGTVYSVDVPASETVMFKWSNTAGKQRFYLDDVTLYATGGGGVPSEPQPPVLDLDPDVEAVTLFEGQEYEIEVTATEYDGDEITLSASGELVTEDTWEAEGGTGSVTGYFIWTPQTTGTWNVVFSATDKDGTTNRTVAFTVVPEGPGSLAFESDGVHVRESAGTVTLTVARTNGAAGAVTVAWATMDGTAAAGSEYVAGGGALSFANGQTEATLSVALLDDTTAEDNKSFSVVLGNVTGGASLGDVTTCTVTIVDDDDANASYYASCYKNGVLKTGDDLKDALCRILNTGVKTNSYGSRLDDILQVTDRHSTNGSSTKVRCIYLQEGITSFNKEHIWAQSHGIDESGPAYSDLHHIRACNSTMNSTRGDKDFDNRQNVSGATEVNGCWYTSKAWEPPDAAKGDVARAVLYMDVRYENKYNGKVDLETVDSVGTSTDGNQLGKLSTLIAWNELDPPDDFERRRNELIYTTYQYNRNPFIDHPTWVRAVFDPSNFTEEAITWTVNVTVEGAGWVNGNASAFSVDVTNGLTKTFLVQPDAASYCHIGSIAWNGTVVPQAYYTNASYYNYTCPAVSNNSTLAVVFASETAALGTPVWWLAQYGTNSTAVAQQDWDAAELEDWNDDGVPNWQEYQAGNDPTAFALRQVTGVAVSGETTNGFVVSWNAVDYVDGYRVRVCETTHVVAATAGFENGEVDAGWTVSASGTTVATNGAMEGTWGLSLSTNGAWLAWGGDVENPVSVTFKYKRSGNATAWALAAQVSTDGGMTWETAGSVTDAVTVAKSAEIDLSAWHGQTVRVRLVDARAEGNAARYVDDVTIWRGGGTVAEGTTSATTWTATGLSADTGYDVQVRGEATTLGTAVGPWSEPVRATTLLGADTRQEQTITFPAIADQTVGATVALEATASSGLAVEYAVSGPATLSGSTLACTAAGTVTVTASQPGNTEWKPAADVTRTFTVTELVLDAPSAVWASATNATDFTAAWSAVDGATGYELSVWTETAGGSIVVTNETVLFSTTFADITGNGNARLNANAIDGWTFTNAFAATNEIKVGVTGAGGAVTSATYTAEGSLRVVSEAHAWGSDATVLWVAATGQAAQSNQLDAASGRFTNTFEGVNGEVTVSWATTAGKKRFLLEAVEISVLSEGEGEGGGQIVSVEGYDGRAVADTSCAVTGLVAGTTYFFQVRATAGETTGPWSETATVTTAAEGGETTPEAAYAAWLTGLGLDVATYPMAGAGKNGYGNWQNYLWDIAPTSTNGLEITAMALTNGNLVLTVPLASARRNYVWVWWTALEAGKNPLDGATEVELGPGTTTMTITNGLPAGGFGMLKATVE
jgi:endonuclease I